MASADINNPRGRTKEKNNTRLVLGVFFNACLSSGCIKYFILIPFMVWLKAASLRRGDDQRIE